MILRFLSELGSYTHSTLTYIVFPNHLALTYSSYFFSLAAIILHVVLDTVTLYLCALLSHH